jgi:alpha-glucosidase
MVDEGHRAWWKRAVIYQIYPRSFADSDGDGIGDIAGILSKLDYLSHTIAVDAIWLSPFYPSPQKDYGYDVADYTDVNPEYGTMEEFDHLVRACHERSMRVIVDFVPNHSSDQHAWFIESRSSRDNPKRDWYVWKDPRPDGGPPTNWVAVFGGSAWEWDDTTGQYYLHSFLKEQPDLNWRNPEVRAAMHDAMRFWLDHGVDGFRIDVAHFIAKDPDFHDNPPAPLDTDPGPFRHLSDYEAQLHLYDKGHPDVHEYFREIRAMLDEYGDRYAVGEIHEFDWNVWTSYHGSADELHQVFDFSLINAPWDAATIRSLVEAQEAVLPDHAWPNHVLGNHDVPRIAFRRGESAARIAAVLLLATRGTPTLYYGDELGMTQPVIPAEQQLDPWGQAGAAVGRDGCRTPMQWSTGPFAGFTPRDGEPPWLPVQTDYASVNVETELGEPNSILNLYRRLLAVRRTSPVLQLGDYRSLEDVPEAVYAFERTLDEARMVVAMNFGGDAVTVSGIDGEVVVATDLRREGEQLTGELLLGGGQAVVVRT